MPATFYGTKVTVDYSGGGGVRLVEAADVDREVTVSSSVLASVGLGFLETEVDASGEGFKPSGTSQTLNLPSGTELWSRRDSGGASVDVFVLVGALH